jgi:hypothetical protein
VLRTAVAVLYTSGFSAWFSHARDKEVNLVSFFKSTSNIGKIGVAISVFAISLLVLDAPAQAQSYECVDTYSTVPVRRAAVRRATRQYNAARAYRTVRARTVVRPVVETIYVPVREVSYDDEYVTNGRYGNRAVDADYYDTRRIASDYGYRDGFYDGHQAGIERDTYHPENSGDYQKATNGYEDDFGPKYLYRQAYRNAYLRGYDAGWRSVAQRHTYRSGR